ncbi:glycosyltransferase family 4 protein [Daejeonella sp.]|uniref:glycosyltransferase family 4 protein n=1 Tax=Daejeonella sp. TaxID=2805397 RepID=UPI0030BCFC21
MESIIIISPWVGRIGPNTFITGFIRENLFHGNKITILYPFKDKISEDFSERGCNVIYVKSLMLSHVSNIYLKIARRFLSEALLFFIFPFLLMRKRYTFCLVNTELLSFSLILPSLFVKLITIVHSLSFEASSLSKFVFRIQHLIIYKYVAVSKAVKDSLVKCGVRRPIHMVYNGLNLNEFVPVGVVMRDEKIINIITVIHSLPHKGAHYLLEVLKQVVLLQKNFHCTIIGWGSPQHDNEYKRMIEDKAVLDNLQQYITFKGSTDSMHYEYSNADILLHPSESESFGYVLIEAMASRLPVIAFAVGGMTEIVEDQVSGRLIKPYDVNMMAAAVIDQIRNAALRKQYGIAGRAIVEEKFNLNTNMRKINELIKQSH